MKLVALISGGKDSCFNMMQCIAAGHEIVALANITPQAKTEIDSYMFQSVGFEAIDLIAEAMDLPLFRLETSGMSCQRGKEYEPVENDEVEDLYQLIKNVKDELNVEGVASGAILSDYQRIRVENICIRLGLVSLAYLWQRDQAELLQEMIKCEIDAVIIKVAALGLEPSRHLGRSLRLLEPHLHSMHEQYGLNVCGEGGEYETLTLDCPLFKSRIIIEESEVVLHSDDPIAPVGFLKLNKLRLDTKLPILDLKARMNGLPIKDSEGYITNDEEETVNIADESKVDDKAAEDALTGATKSEEEIKTDITTDSLLIAANSVSKQPCISGKSGDGWLWIGGVVGESDDNEDASNLETPVKKAVDKLQSVLESYGKSTKDICSVSMYVSDMGRYAEFNKIYCETVSHVNPPTRACVQVPLPNHCPIILEAVAWLPPTNAATGDSSNDRITMHVQSISHWCPANIGPYSQAAQVGDLIHLAGQIGLVPGNMQLVKGGIKKQCQLALRHVGRLLKAMDPNVNLRDVVQGICYVSDIAFIEHARKLWEERTNNAIVDYVVVTGLPRDALIEWHVWAHRHNSQFDYEETGKCIDNWTISLYRRWNFENNTAAVVCHLEHPEDVELTQEIFMEVLTYSINKLMLGHEGDVNSLCAIKVFYPVKKGVSMEAFYDILKEVHESTGTVQTVIPVYLLQSPHTYLSICGIRNQ